MPRHTGFASLPLHGGKAPPWLFGRMVRLSREIVIYLASEYGTREVLRRLSDPFWFQAFGCVLGFDWHSSGVTTTVCGAVKEALRDVDADLGFFAAGGKGHVSRKTPQHITEACERIGRDPQPLVYASRTAAKVDSAAVQDGYQLYHHVFFFTGAGDWCVVQQGMNDANHRARRYHWLSEHVASFVDDPHEAVCCDARAETLNLVAHENDPVRRASAQLAAQPPEVTLKAFETAQLETASAGNRTRMLPMLGCRGGMSCCRSSMWPARISKDSVEDLRARAGGFRDAARDRGRRSKDAARVGARVGAGARYAGDDVRPGALLVRARRQGRHAVSGRQADLRQDDRDPEQSDQPLGDRSVGKGEGVQKARGVRDSGPRRRSKPKPKAPKAWAKPRA